MHFAIHSRRSGPIPPPPDIHPAWCTCDECTGHESFRRDLRALAIGFAIGLAIIALKFMGAF